MATFAYNHGNLGAAALTADITTTTTSITVDSTDAETFPSIRFYATICPAGQTPNSTNSEVVLVRLRSGGTLTVLRAQRDTTAKAFSAGAIIMNGVYAQDLDYAQSVGKTIFSATNVSTTSSYSNWNIDSDMLPATPVDGMKIRVVFESNTSGPAARLRLNVGIYYYVYAGAGLTANATNVVSQTSFNPKSGVVYELVFNGSAWYALNVPAGKSITSDNIDLTTLSSTGTSITITAGTWLVTHKISVGQVTVGSPIVLLYTLTGFPSQTTIAGNSSVQNLWQSGAESAIITVSSSTTLSRTNSVSTNVETRDEYWTATRIK